MSERNAELLGITEAAKRLGVHPNTLRSWTDQAMIRYIRLPSGHRRFIASEIEKLRRDMGFEDTAHLDDTRTDE